MRHFIAIIVAFSLLALPYVASTYPDQFHDVLSVIQETGNQLAAVILSHNPKTVAQIQADYASASAPVPKKVRILIVPGHEPGYGGAEFGSVKERLMTVELGDDLQQFLDTDGHYQTFITRSDTAWAPTFADYFKNNWNDIVAWQQASHNEMSHLVSVGSITTPVSSVQHNVAPQDVALRLYGITKWANENDIDITIHIHFNDNPGHPNGVAGSHSGFAIYVPTGQYGNSSTTKAVADTIFKRLSKYNPVSDLPGESTGIVDEPDLIAIGANNTADSASMLIEYSYIYEPQLVNPDLRSTALKDLAYQTYLGLQDFFDPNKSAALARSYDTLVLPHTWISPLNPQSTLDADVFALQTALQVDGDYPPADKSMNACPRTGGFGGCTKAAIASFQKKNDISGEVGVVGSATIKVLNQKFSL